MNIPPRLIRCNQCQSVGVVGSIIKRETYGKIIELNLCTACTAKRCKQQREEHRKKVEAIKNSPKWIRQKEVNDRRRIRSAQKKHDLVCAHIASLIEERGYLVHSAIAKALKVEDTAVTLNQDAIATIRKELISRLEQAYQQFLQDGDRAYPCTITELYEACNTHSETLFEYFGWDNIQDLLRRINDHRTALRRKLKQDAFDAKTRELNTAFDEMIAAKGTFLKREFLKSMGCSHWVLEGRPELNERLDTISAQHKERLKRERVAHIETALGAIARGESGLPEPLLKSAVIKYIGVSFGTLERYGFSDRIDALVEESFRQVISAKLDAIEQGRSPLTAPYAKEAVIEWVGYRRPTIKNYGLWDRLERIVYDSKPIRLVTKFSKDQLRKEEYPASYLQVS